MNLSIRHTIGNFATHFLDEIGQAAPKHSLTINTPIRHVAGISASAQDRVRITSGDEITWQWDRRLDRRRIDKTGRQIISMLRPTSSGDNTQHRHRGHAKMPNKADALFEPLTTTINKEKRREKKKRACPIPSVRRSLRLVLWHDNIYGRTRARTFTDTK